MGGGRELMDEGKYLLATPLHEESLLGQWHIVIQRGPLQCYIGHSAGEAKYGTQVSAVPR